MTTGVASILFILLFLSLCGWLLPSVIRRRDMKLLCSVTSPDRGTPSERRLVVKLLKRGIHPKAIFHDLYLKKQNGEYAQIDIVVVTPQGILAIEVKEYTGWLYGNGHQRYWTKLVRHGHDKFHFYNPVFQNAGHIRALREQSRQFSYLPIYNIILFDGDCVLKEITDLPDYTFIGYSCGVKKLLKVIRKMEQVRYTDKKEIVRVLRQAVQNGNDPSIVEGHIVTVKEIISRTQSSGNWLIRFLRRLWRWLIGS